MTLIFKSHCYFGVGESEGWGGGSFGSDLQVDIPSRSGLMSGGQGGTDHLGQRAGPHCSRTPSIKMTFERHVYSGSKNKTKQNVFFRPNYLPSYSRRIPPDGSHHQPPPRAVGPEALPSDSAELWTRWTNRPRCTVTAVSLFFFLETGRALSETHPLIPVERRQARPPLPSSCRGLPPPGRPPGLRTVSVLMRQETVSVSFTAGIF